MEKTSLTFTGTPEEIRMRVHSWDRSDDLAPGDIDSPLETFDLEGVSISDTDPAGLESNVVEAQAEAERLRGAVRRLQRRLCDKGASPTTVSDSIALAVANEKIHNLEAALRNKTDDCTEATEHARHWESCFCTVADHRDRLLRELGALKANPPQVVVHDPLEVASLESCITALLGDIEAVRKDRDNRIQSLEHSLTLARAGSDKNFDDARLWQGRAVSSQKEADSLREAVAQLQLDLKEAEEGNATLRNRVLKAIATLQP